MEEICKKYFNFLTEQPLTLILARIQSEAPQAERTLKIIQSHCQCKQQYYELLCEVGTLLHYNF